MTRRTKIIIVLIGLGTAFAVGRYTVPEKVRIETKVVEVEKKSSVADIDLKRDKKKNTTITETKKPDGTITTVTTVTEDTKTDKQDKTTTNDNITTNSDSVNSVVRGGSKVTISALGGLDFSSGKPVFGACLSKPVLGPITIGVWGLSNASGGASVGLTF